MSAEAATAKAEFTGIDQLRNEAAEWWSPWETFTVKLAFTLEERLEFFAELAALIDINKPLRNALEEIQGVHSQDGKKPSDPVAVVAGRCVEVVAEGRSITLALAPFVTAVELSVIAVSEEAGGDALKHAFDRCVESLEQTTRLRAAAWQPLTGTLFAIGFLVLSLFMLSYGWLPELKKAVGDRHLSGALGTLQSIAVFWTWWSWAFIAVGVSLITFVRWTLDNTYRDGPTGRLLDRVPPYSIYSRMQGALFLENISALFDSGVPVQTAITRLMESSGRYVWVRLVQVREEISGGANFGLALSRNDFEFPDRAAIAFMRSIGQQGDYGKVIGRFQRRWLERSIKKIRKAAHRTNLVLMIGVVSWLLFVVSAVLSMGTAVGGR